MRETERKPRGHSVPRVGWWCDAATEAAKSEGITHVRLAEILLERFGLQIASTSVGRVLNGKVLTLDTAELISELFGLPPPIIYPTSQEQALRLLGQQERDKVRASVAELHQKVDARGKSQSGPVRSPDDRVQRGRSGR